MAWNYGGKSQTNNTTLTTFIPERVSFRNEFRSRMKFVLNSYVKAFSLAPDQIRMRHLPQTRKFAIFNSERSYLSV